MNVLEIFRLLGPYFRQLLARRQLVEHNPELLQAAEFSKNFAAQQGVDYEWVVGYAKDHWNRLEAVFKQLDDKADGVIKYLSGGTGLLAIGTLLTITKTNALIFLSAMVPGLLAICTILVGCWARMPIGHAFPPSVANTIRYAEYFKATGEETFLGQWHLACEFARLAIAEKGRRVDLTFICFMYTMIALIVPLITAICWALA